MSGKKVLVLGGTGPAGICLLRELVHRNHATILLARTPSKLPGNLVSSSLIEVIEGEMSDTKALDSAMARSSIVVSLLGPNINDKHIDPSLYADIYRNYVFPAMKKYSPEDHWTFFQTMVTIVMPLLNGAVYRNMHNLAHLFGKEGHDLDWTIFRIAQIPGESDETSWRQDRDLGLFTGWIGEKGWTSTLRRGALARWLVDGVEGKMDVWVHKMPGISQLAGV
ncbi:uncharacterized protein CCOS01_04893 [Colletotrichum costaricense]|uniref:NAD(P)-binding domain-containing protein n=2 Tax=Colletotrichum acutatum species complex TaxID=2707335 RepID=A0AAJ0E4V9_9PEZI|nr:uncharacterized protein CCOS01_04893 [Colletotrichum costaricense]XP_060386421.1 uncharacterized protein CTAM01_02580 [Colletotrichum tamarilloi]KAK1507468.1 hypothetical protein CTAM01_02580 [Colletotrichum tamarilloi]KAK1532910.1 hypothetical protein CCOS01_04893 [Colletotrichum costaricense]